MRRDWAVRGRAAVRSRSAEVRMLVVMLLVSTVAAGLGAVLPMTPSAPTRLNAVLALVGAVSAVAVWCRPHLLPWRLVGPAVVVAGVGGIVAAAATPGGTATSASPAGAGAPSRAARRRNAASSSGKARLIVTSTGRRSGRAVATSWRRVRRRGDTGTSTFCG